MKKNIFILCFIILGNIAFSQVYIDVQINQPLSLEANAGPDLSVCDGDSILLGAIPSAINGTPSYTYLWEPSNGLNNPNNPNPMASPNAGTTYVLTVSDANGCTHKDTLVLTVNDCTFLEDVLNFDNAINIYPNPSHSIFNISINNTHGIYSNLNIELFNILGKSIFFEKIEAANLNQNIEKTIDVSHLNNGVYFIKISHTEKTITKKIIVN